MPPAGSRRAFLAGVGAAALSRTLAGGASAATPTTTEPCDAVADRRATLEAKRERLEALRRERAELRDRIDTLGSEIPSARAAWIERQHEHEPLTRERARAVGLDVRDSVVVVDLRFPDGATSGTGWVVADGLIVTNSHVVSDWERTAAAYGWSIDGERFPLDLLGRVETLSPDVALLATPFDGPPLPTGNPLELEEDTPLVAVGHPGSYGNWVISLGAFERWNGRDRDELVTDVPSLQGNSGSPTMTLDGEVVGMLKGAGGVGEPEGAPQPADPAVQTEPLTPEETVLHDSIETVMNLVGRWT